MSASAGICRSDPATWLNDRWPPTFGDTSGIINCLEVPVTPQTLSACVCQTYACCARPVCRCLLLASPKQCCVLFPRSDTRTLCGSFARIPAS